MYTVGTMNDFSDIPSVCDVYQDAGYELAGLTGVESADELEETTKRGKYAFNGKYIYATWAKSRIDEKDEFRQKLLAVLPGGARVYGGRELGEDGTLNYHAAILLVDKVNWPDAVKELMIEGDTNAIRFEKPTPRQTTRNFLENTMAYCAKDGDTFGESLCLEGGDKESVAEVQSYRDATTKLAAREGGDCDDVTWREVRQSLVARVERIERQLEDLMVEVKALDEDDADEWER